MAVHMADRIRDVGVTIFSEMSALAAKHGAVNLGQGFPDFPGPALVKDAAARAIAADHNQYAPTNGLPAFQQAAAAEWERRYGRAVDPAREVTVTSGATEALLVAVLAYVQPGDEVILLEPYYDSYPVQVRLAGGVPVFVRLGMPGFTLDVERIAAAVTPRTRAIMLNTPANPCGRVFTEQELRALAALACQRDLLVISDEVYDRLVFAPHRHLPIAMLPGMWDRTITIHSTGKTFSVTGWKIGYALAAPPLTDGFRRVHQFCTFTTATPLQAGIVEGLRAGADYERVFLAEYAARRDLLVDILRRAGFGVDAPEGTYFVMADYRGFRGMNDLAFCRWLTTEVGVAAIPPSAFFHDGHPCGMVRFCFAKKDETLRAAGERFAARLPRLG
ncbi:MAG: aminotransferase class I/II-fold pyridoxal phosphate-dependent enzyme [Deltaproteobacteria bacterium]|nr:aminotransferase class I/II-fold pyridoxal phosphate-dependent enzyme [Deltaproteobacteria bacterium]